MKLGLKFHGAISSRQGAFPQFQHHPGFIGGFKLAANAPGLTRRKTEARVVLGVAQYDHYFVAKLAAFFEAGSNQLRANSLALVGGQNRYRGEGYSFEAGIA